MISNKLNVLIAERGLSAFEVHKDTGISRSTLANIIKGGSPQTDTLDKLCMYFHIEPQDFFIYSPYEIDFSAVTAEEKNMYKLFSNVVHFQDETLLSSQYTFEQIHERNYVVTFEHTDEIMDIINGLNVIFHKDIKQQLCDAVESVLMLDQDLVENAKGKVYVNYKMPWFESYQKTYSRK